MKKICNLILLGAVLMISSGITSCCCHKNCCSRTTKESKRNYEKEGYVLATVIKIDLDGCNYLLKLNSDKKLEATNLSDELKKEHSKVWIKYVPDSAAMSICMAGELVKLTEFVLVK